MYGTWNQVLHTNLHTADRQVSVGSTSQAQMLWGQPSQPNILPTRLIQDACGSLGQPGAMNHQNFTFRPL